MENVSKALIMAAGILIGIMILSMVIYLFQGATQIPKKYNEKLEKEKIEAFNSKFEVYNTENISAQDIVTVINMAVDNNRDYIIENIDYYINVYLNGKIVNEYSEEQKVNLMKQVEVKDNIFPFKCKNIVYSNITGRIIEIEFIEK